LAVKHGSEIDIVLNER